MLGELSLGYISQGSDGGHTRSPAEESPLFTLEHLCYNQQARFSSRIAETEIAYDDQR